MMLELGHAAMIGRALYTRERYKADMKVVTAIFEDQKLDNEEDLRKSSDELKANQERIRAKMRELEASLQKATASLPSKPTVVKIGKTHFLTANIRDILITRSMPIRRIETFRSVQYYTHGNVKKDVSFDCAVLLKQPFDYKDFESSIEKSEPLDFLMLNSSFYQKILVHTLTCKSSQWFPIDDTVYPYVKEYSVQGYLM